MLELNHALSSLEVWARDQQRIGQNLLESLDKYKKLCYSIKYGVVNSRDLKKFPDNNSKIIALAQLLENECPHGPNGDII